jgi:hypothetical protein
MKFCIHPQVFFLIRNFGRLLYMFKKAIEKYLTIILAWTGVKTSICIVIYAIRMGLYLVEE